MVAEQDLIAKLQKHPNDEHYIDITDAERYPSERSALDRAYA